MEWRSGSIFIREAMKNAKKGTTIEGHTHNFDHTTMLTTGKVYAKVSTASGEILKEGEFSAPWYFLIDAQYCHSFEALEENTTVLCVYSHRTPRGDVTEVFNGWSPAYK